MYGMPWLSRAISTASLSPATLTLPLICGNDRRNQSPPMIGVTRMTTDMTIRTTRRTFQVRCMRHPPVGQAEASEGFQIPLSLGRVRIVAQPELMLTWVLFAHYLTRIWRDRWSFFDAVTLADIMAGYLCPAKGVYHD